MLVTLKSPPNAKVQGIVAGIVEQRLTLQNGISSKELNPKFNGSNVS